ncbi:MAG: ketopantoate reductase family protein [Candidatus Accumulibacter sp.]|jgi:2-dehydropantoate 2-reductase|nr:ketopantoate reductase family protein [Accumulibacter sp.]
MKIAIMGAGAVGCCYGGALARAGHDVWLIGRARHVEAIAGRGLWLETEAGVETIAVSATAGADAAAGAELVLCCVKSDDTAAAAEAMAAHLDAGAVVVSLQNGIGNAAVLRARLTQEVIPAAIYIAARMAGDGHALRLGGGKVVLGESASAGRVAAIFSGAGVPVEISADILGEQWTKLIVNCAYNALSALTALPYGELARRPGVAEALRDVVGECLAVAEKAGVAPAGDVWESVERIPRTMPGQISSTAQDLLRGRRTEIEHLNGAIARLGEELGVPAPVNRLLTTLVKLRETPPS